MQLHEKKRERALTSSVSRSSQDLDIYQHPAYKKAEPGNSILEKKNKEMTDGTCMQ